MPNDFEQKLSLLKEMVAARIQHILSPQSPHSLYDPMLYAVSAGGKKLRPVLLLLVNEALGGHPTQAIHAAVALELVHNFTLVHDDIMDHDDLRRGRETLHKHWDESAAILAGDGLHVLAFRELAQTSTSHMQKIIQVFSEGILQVCEGQALDKDFEARDKISMDEYYDMIDKKTGKLFAVACHIGAVLADATERQTLAMIEYGMLLGRAFQIQDDLLDVVSEESVLGKDIGSDIQEHKKSFLAVHALAVNPHKCRLLLEKRRLSSHDIQQIIGLFKDIGTLDAARDEIARVLAKSRQALQEMPPGPNAIYLADLVEKIASRAF